MSLHPAMKRPRQRRESEARRGAHLACPDCGSPATIRSSHVMTPTMRTLDYSCTNHECGATFAARLEVVYRLSLPAQPNPAVNLPLSTRIDRGQLNAVLAGATDVAPERSAMPPITADLFGDHAPP